MSAASHRAWCDCGNAATVRLGSAWICANCFAIDSARQRQEREQRERQRQERRNKLRDEYAPSANFYTFAGNRR